MQQSRRNIRSKLVNKARQPVRFILRKRHILLDRECLRKGGERRRAVSQPFARRDAEMSIPLAVLDPALGDEPALEGGKLLVDAPDALDSLEEAREGDVTEDLLGDMVWWRERMRVRAPVSVSASVRPPSLRTGTICLSNSMINPLSEGL